MALFNARKQGILVKALLGTSLRIAAVVVVLSALFLIRHQAAFLRQLELRAESTARSMATQGQFALLVGNREELDAMARAAIESSEDVLYVVVENAAGRTVGGARRSPLGWADVPIGAPAGEGATVRRVTVGRPGMPSVEVTVAVAARAEGGLFSLSPPPAGTFGQVRVGMSLASQKALFLNSLRYVAAISLLILLAALGMEYFQFRRLLAPLAELARVAHMVGRRDYSGFLGVQHHGDEIGVLVDSFQQMVAQVAEHTHELREEVNAKERARAELAEAQQRLIELSRKSGMAEVATSVLHNVGNVLNSVNVSATLVTSKVRESRVEKLQAVTDMLAAHAGSLDHYLRNDPKGQRMLPYLSKLAGHLQQERELVIHELELLARNVNHIKQIVSTQQSYARMSGLIEKVSLEELVEDAVRIVQPGAENRDIAILRDFEELPRFSADKHQIFQILLNLLRNAIRAVRDADTADRVVRIRLRRHGEDRVRLEVKDSGIGLPREHLTRVFGHGFTTKADGHGFGLHSGALAAKQLGGSLTADSDGPGCGATFTLELPLVIPQHCGKEIVAA